jgi:hypothetical protein
MAATLDRARFFAAARPILGKFDQEQVDGPIQLAATLD